MSQTVNIIIDRSVSDCIAVCNAKMFLSVKLFATVINPLLEGQKTCVYAHYLYVEYFIFSRHSYRVKAGLGWIRARRNVLVSLRVQWQPLANNLTIVNAVPNLSRLSYEPGRQTRTVALCHDMTPAKLI